LAYLVVFSVYLAWVIAALGIGCFLTDLLGLNRENNESFLKDEIKFAVWGFLLAAGSFILILSVIGDVVAAGVSSIATFFLAAIALRRLSVITPAFWILFGVLLINAEPAQRVLQVENWNGWSQFQEAKLSLRKTDSGLSLYVAQDDCLCRDAPLPCASRFEPKLQAEISDDGKFRMFWLSDN
jgi:hypothetical protein